MLEVIVAGASLLLLAGGIRGGVSLARLLRKTRGSLPPGAGPADRPENVRRLLKHLVRSPIASLTDGVATVIHGRVSGDATLRAPLTGTVCIGFHVWIRTVNVQRALLHDHARCGDFTLADASGSLAVAGDGLELAITRGEIRRFAIPLPAWLVLMIPAYHQWEDIEVSEGVLVSGDAALVCGVASSERGVDNYRDGETVTISLHATPTFPLVASTDADLVMQGDRPIDPEELPR